MKFFDRLKAKLGLGGKADDVVQAMDPDEVFTGNRAYIRAYMRNQRLRGPGYTRPMRGGRTQRVRTQSDAITNDAAEAAEGSPS